MPVSPMSDLEDDKRFSNEDDGRLAKFLWVHGTRVTDRSGVQMYSVLGPQASDKFAWSRHIAAEAWCRRYKAHATEFDAWAEDLQRAGEQEQRRQEPAPTVPPVVKIATVSSTAGSETNAKPKVRTRGTATPRSSGPVQKNQLGSSPSAAGSPPTRKKASQSWGKSSAPPTAHDAPQPTPRKQATQFAGKGSAPPAGSSTSQSTQPVDQVSPTEAHAVHRRLARAARKTMFTVDFAWAIYVETGSVGETKAVLER
ncbi:hypothetical protein B0H16DRAFT_1895658, partial [Mycena metata]